MGEYGLWFRSYGFAEIEPSTRVDAPIPRRRYSFLCQRWEYKYFSSIAQHWPRADFMPLVRCENAEFYNASKLVYSVIKVNFYFS